MIPAGIIFTILWHHHVMPSTGGILNTRIVSNDLWRNERTGELIETQTLSRELKDVDIGFNKIWINHILETIEEIGNAKIKVLFWLMQNKDKNNMVNATVRQIAEHAGVGEATVKRLMAALRKADIVRLEYGGRWILNPSLIFKGGHDRRMNVLIRYQQVELTSNSESNYLDKDAA
jgi:DNA-binding transcriptional ArsR family regulator